MLVPVINEPRDYPWGSQTLLAQLQGRAATGKPEAEVWFGDHPGCPARVPDGRTLGQWLSSAGPRSGEPGQLPYLVKLLAADSPLSIQAHPSKAQAESGFAREEAAGIPRDAPTRTYRDDNHKPELIVAVSETFSAMAGLRDVSDTRRLLEELGAAAEPMISRLSDLRALISWLLSADAAATVAAVHAALPQASSVEFAAELDGARDLARHYPNDPGVLVALLMNRVELRRGEGLYVAAGVLHAYVQGLGVEVMSASDNVLRGGLTEKHIDTDGLIAVLDARTGPAPVIRAEADGPLLRYPTPAGDFAMRALMLEPDQRFPLSIGGLAMMVATSGEVTVTGQVDSVTLSPGQAALATPDERNITVTGTGILYVVTPGSTE